jgi:hypothetical protein
MVQTGAIAVVVATKPDAFLCDHVHARQNEHENFAKTQILMYFSTFTQNGTSVADLEGRIDQRKTRAKDSDGECRPNEFSEVTRSCAVTIFSRSSISLRWWFEHSLRDVTWTSYPRRDRMIRSQR